MAEQKQLINALNQVESITSIVTGESAKRQGTAISSGGLAQLRQITLKKGAIQPEGVDIGSLRKCYSPG